MEIAQGLYRTLLKLCTVFNQEKIEYCLIGGLAVSIVGKPRATEDIDILVIIDEENKKKIEKTMQTHFNIFQIQDMVDFGQTDIWRYVIKDTVTKDKGLFIIDFVNAREDIFISAIKNAKKIIVENVSIPIASASDLIKMKKLSGRKKDLLDIEYIKDENPELPDE